MIFCLGEGRTVSSGAGFQKNLQIFNKPVTEDEYKKVKNALDVKNFKLPIAKWVETKDMTKDEKDNWTSHKQKGGFLKTLSYKDDWAEMWTSLSQEDRNFFKTIVNFDSEIFESITGIKIEDEVAVTPVGKVGDVININGKNWKRID